MSFESTARLKEAWQQNDNKRLARWMRPDFSQSVGLWSEALREFVTVSVEDTLHDSDRLAARVAGLFHVARLVEEELHGQGSDQTQFQREIVPHILNAGEGKLFDEAQWLAQVGQEDPLDLPGEDWPGIEDWLQARWGRYLFEVDHTSDPPQPIGIYAKPETAFFRGTGDVYGSYLPKHTGYRPALFHPLVLRILKSLLHPEDEYTEDLADWLYQKVFELPEPPQVTVGTAFAVGSLLLYLAKRAGVEVTASGIEGGVEGWSRRAGNLLREVARNSAGHEQVRPVWRNRSGEAGYLLEQLTDWHEPGRFGYLRWVASEDFVSAYVGEPTATSVEKLASTFLRTQADLTLAEITPELEHLSRHRLPEYRGKKPLFAAQDTLYLDQLQHIAGNGGSGLTAITRANATSARASRQRALAALENPILRLALADTLANEKVREAASRTNALAQFSKQMAGRIALSSRGFASGVQLLESVGWSQVVNTEVGNDRPDAVLASWMALELWDGLRGRLTGQPEGQNQDAAASLMAQLGQNEFVWLLAPAEIPASYLAEPNPDDTEQMTSYRRLRAFLAAAALLGLPEGHAELLVSRLDSLLLDGNQLSASTSRMLTACRIELGLTLSLSDQSAGEGLNRTVPFHQFDGNEANLQRLLEWADLLLVSANGWERRVGMNLLILLNRVAEASDDLLLVENLLPRTVPDSPAGALIRFCLDTILNSEEALPGSGLPLVLAALELLRYTRALLAGIRLGDLIKRPGWILNSGELLLDGLRTAFLANPNRGGGQATQRFLLTLLQIEIERFQRDRQLSTRPVDRQRVLELNRLRDVGRVLLVGEQLLLHGLPEDEDGLLPWWQIGYWAAEEGSGSLRTGLCNWLDTYEKPVSAELLAEAAALEALVPPVSPSLSPQAGGSKAIFFDSVFLKDIDGRYYGDVSRLNFQAISGALQEAIKGLNAAEDAHLNATKEGSRETDFNRVVDLLKQPLLLSTADFKEQVESALADVRQAETELEVAEHESLVAQFEQFASKLFFEAAQAEVKRQQVLQEIADLEQEMADKQVELAKIDVGKEKIEEHKKILRKAQVANLRRQAEIELQIAARAHAALEEEIRIVRTALIEQVQDVKAPDGSPLGSARGQIGVLALQVKHSIEAQFEAEITEAQVQLADEKAKAKRRRRKKKRNQMITSVCRFVGTAVGAYFGNPALGAEIGAAVGELTVGVMENKPPEAIAFGLVDNSFAIADAAGVDLEKELNELSAKGMAGANAFFQDISTTLEPMMAAMPTILDDQLLKDAFELMGLEEVPELATTLNEVRTTLVQKLSVSSAPELGTILKKVGEQSSQWKGDNVLKLDSPRQLLKMLEGELGKQFPDTAAELERFGALAKAAGADIEELKTEDGRVKIFRRVSEYAISQVGREASGYRMDLLQGWVNGVRGVTKENPDGTGKFWEDVKDEGELLIHELYQDVSHQERALANIKAALVDPKKLQGKLQVIIQRWRAALDEKLDKLMTPGPEFSNPADAEDAAGKRLAYLQDTQQKMIGPGGLFEWMAGKGDSNIELNTLEEKLGDLEKQSEQAQLEVKGLVEKIAGIDLEAEHTDLEIEEALLDVKSARTKLELFELNYHKASLMSVVAEHAFGKAEIEARAQEQLQKAAEARAAAAQAKIRAAQANLQSKRARLSGAERRGAEAHRIRTQLNREPLRRPDFLSAEAAGAKRAHQQALDQAMRHYREMVRYCLWVGLREEEIATPRLWETGEETGVLVHLQWGTALEKWKKGIEEEFRSGKIGYEHVTVPWQLSAEQIKALLSPAGLILTVGSDVEEFPILFSVPRPAEFRELKQEASAEYLARLNQQLESDLDQRQVSSRWRQQFAVNGITLSEHAQFHAREKGVWQVRDSGATVRVRVHDQEGRRIERDHGVNDYWEINNRILRKDYVAYRIVRLDQNKGFDVRAIRRHSSGWGKGRTATDGHLVLDLPPSHFPSTARIVALFYDARDRDTDEHLARTPKYSIEVFYNGTHYRPPDHVLELRAPARLLPHRIVEPHLKPWESEIREKERDFDQFVLEGPPLQGVTTIRMYGTAPGPNPRFEKLTLEIMYKYYTRSESAFAAHVIDEVKVA